MSRGRSHRASQLFVSKELKNIKSSKSTDLAAIPACLLKDGFCAIARPLTVLMNRSPAEGSIPPEWKYATVTPVHKSDSRTNPANYRPISVLRPQSSYQSGLCSLQSTSTCLTDVTNTLLQNIDNVIRVNLQA